MKNRVDFTELAKDLPPLISRDHVEKLLGGVISSKSLANLDSLGEGPERMRIGRKIAYLTEDLLRWLESRTTNLN
jgi:predicted DNA-binding transcriptional regulator AlpA